MSKLLLLAPVLLLASCHGAQVALPTQAPVAEAIAAPAPPVAFDSTLAATVVAHSPAAPVAPAPTVMPTRQAPPAPQRSHRAGGVRPLPKLTAAIVVAPAAKRLAHQLQRQRPTEGAAESGLGGIALFFIGVVLALLAGLAALVSLIPGVSFWGGLGLAAAGLVVLYLLYSLLSGGKKKK